MQILKITIDDISCRTIFDTIPETNPYDLDFYENISHYIEPLLLKIKSKRAPKLKTILCISREEDSYET